MATRQASNGRLKSIVGGALLAIGSCVLLFDAGSLALQARHLLSASGAEAIGVLAAAGLALLHTLQAAAFDCSILLSVVSNMLILFSAFVIVATGMALLRKQLANALAQQQLSSFESLKGDQ
jgi:hypothetical protein